jgi:excisionase family DNA binding protein
MESETKALVGRRAICQYLDISHSTFYRLKEEGMPVKKVGKTWCSHKDDLDRFFRVKKAS